MNAGSYRRTLWEIRNVEVHANDFKITATKRDEFGAPRVSLVVNENRFTEEQLMKIHEAFSILEVSGFAVEFNEFSSNPARLQELVHEAQVAREALVKLEEDIRKSQEQLKKQKENNLASSNATGDNQ